MNESFKIPRRFKFKNSDTFGCYFPKTDLSIGQMGNRGTGAPKDIDPVDDLSWIENKEIIKANND